MQTSPILVIGSTGKTGSRIARILAARGHDVRHGARGAAIPFDWQKPDTWPRALQGVSAAYVSYFPDLAVPGASDAIAALSETAKAAGVKRLVLLSGRGETHAEHCETIVRDSGLEYTLVRCAWFMQNFSEGYLHDPVLDGVIPLPGGQVREPMIDVDDIAEVAVAALTEDGHSGELYELTGPRLMTFEEAAEDLTVATGRPVRHVPISFEEFHTAIAQVAGDFIADVFTGIARETLDGRNARLADGVERALGRPPRDFREFSRRAAAAGAWKQAA